MAQTVRITLYIKPAGTGAEQGFAYHVMANGKLVQDNPGLSPENSKIIRDFSRRYTELFERRKGQYISPDALHSLGCLLFHIWLAPVWSKLQAEIPVGAHRTVVIASDVPEILNLPWEMLCPPDGDFLGLDPRYSIRRLPTPDAELPEFEGKLPPRPLRILFMACAPQDAPPLDYEREEEFLLRATSTAGPNVALDIGDQGTFEELRQRVNDFKPHVVHLTGHGVIGDDGLGYFAFEDERGKTDSRSSVEIRRKVFSGSDVQCVFVSGCQSGKAPPVDALGGICQGLVGDEVPLAIGWAASIADDTATLLARTFYDTLASGQPVDRALTQARQAIRKMCDDRGIPEWTLPVLYSSTTQDLVYDIDPHRKPVPPPRTSMVVRALPGMTEGHAEHFVGRRRELQRLLPSLREGSVQTVIISGLGGAGKSTLATRLARRLETDGFTPIPVPSKEGVPLTAARLLETCGDAFLAADLKDAHSVLRSAEIPVGDRLRYIVNTLNKGRFLLVLDNFEVNLDEKSRRILDEELAGFYEHLLENLSGGSRAIITSRYLPSSVPKLPPIAQEQPLGDFPESSFIKFLLREPEVERRYRDRELPHALLAELHGLLGGTPRFLDQIRYVLKTIDSEDLRKELGQVKLPGAGKPGVLQEARDRYCESIFTARLYGYLCPESQKALSKAAVYNIPVNLEALAAVAGEPVQRIREFTREWQSHALAYPERERTPHELWTTYGLLRTWLLADERLSPDERLAAHKAAGDFLRDLVNEKRAADLGQSWVDVLLEARAQYISCADWQQAREMTNRVSGFLVRQGLYADLARLNAEMLAFEEHPASMNWLGRAFDAVGEYLPAREWYQRALDSAGNSLLDEAAAAWHGLGTIDLEVGDYDSAREKSEKSLAIRQQIGDRAGEAATWHSLATIDVEIGDYDLARENFEKSLAIQQRIGDRAGEAATWHSLATIDLSVGDYDSARENFEKSLAINQQIGNRAGAAAAWHQLATVDAVMGHHDLAREEFEKSLGTNQQIGGRYGEGATFCQLGMLARETGRGAEGLRLVALGSMIYQSIGHGDAKAAIGSVLGMATELQYTREQVEALLQEVAEEYKKDRGWGLIRAALPEMEHEPPPE